MDETEDGNPSEIEEKKPKFILEKEHSEADLNDAVKKVAGIINEAEGKVAILTDILPRPGNDLQTIMKTHLSLKQLVDSSKVHVVLTESVDGFHNLAGFSK